MSSHRSPELALASAGMSVRPSGDFVGSDRATAASSTARDAIDTVVRLADAQAARSDAGSRSVSLGFKFGDEHLSVRVELRGGEVHTQFITHSAELRDALASQWSAMTSAGNSARSQLDFAPAQFSSPSSADQRGQSGGGSGQAREGREQSGSFGSRLGAGARPAASAATVASVSSASAAIAAGVPHLNALA